MCTLSAPPIVSFSCPYHSLNSSSTYKLRPFLIKNTKTFKFFFPLLYSHLLTYNNTRTCPRPSLNSLYTHISKKLIFSSLVCNPFHSLPPKPDLDTTLSVAFLTCLYHSQSSSQIFFSSPLHPRPLLLNLHLSL